MIALEKTGSYDGTYHVLHGIISPVDGIGPEDLKIDDLIERIKDQQVSELVLATNPNLEGEATAMYISRLVSDLGIRVTRLARGLPVGADLGYADQVTLSRAIEGPAGILALCDTPYRRCPYPRSRHSSRHCHEK